MEKLIPSMSLGSDVRYKEMHVLVIPALLDYVNWNRQKGVRKC